MVPAMPDRSSKHPRDPNQLAKFIVDAATGEGNASFIAEPKIKDAAAVSLGKRGGAKGGPARAALLSAERRSEIAKSAAAARWKKHDS